jgi:pimeloyl-ACP methyl ester carboxylesterase
MMETPPQGATTRTTTREDTMGLLRSVIVGAFCAAASWIAVGGGQEAKALSCGSFAYPYCQGSQTQFAGGFAPGVGSGGFGGGSCTATRTPIVFVHGNGDSAIGWASPANTAPSGYAAPGQSVYDYFKAQGYNDCELFGVTYLDSSERGTPALNYHSSAKYAIIKTFIDKVKLYTGKTQVDVVAHSLGTSMALATLKTYGNWSSVRRFVNIAGGVRGLNACLYTGYANAYATTCGSENLFNSSVFGFYPDSGVYGYGNNRWTGAGSSGLRNLPAVGATVQFYTIGAGQQDQIHCSTAAGWSSCAAGPTFTARSNVVAQINIGAGSTAAAIDMNLSDNLWTNANGGDTNGVGHFKARNNSATIIHRMLTTTCAGLSCASAYSFGPKVSY